MTDATSAAGPSTLVDPLVRRRVARATFGILIGLLVEFLLGMWLNLFVKIPDGHPGAQPTEYFGGSLQSVAWAITGSGLPALVFHAVWGLLLVVGSLAMIFTARRMRRRAVTAAAILAFLLILGAGFNGASFLDFGENFSSMIMALLFALAMLCYGAILYLVSVA